MAVYGNKAYKGKYRIKHPRKYKGNPKDIVYRSSWELRFMKYCDLHTNVIQWSSEEIIIPYISPIDGKSHRYFMDFWAKVKKPDGTIKQFIIEVKPKKFCQPPTKRQRKTKKYIEEVAMWGVNQAKWEQAKIYAEKRGMEFMIMTEDHLT